MKKWATVPSQEQEKAVGRRKKDSKELSDKLKPPTAHISRVVTEENGKELEIVRHSFPYGTAGDGLHDHLMGFTRAVTGATFLLPHCQY